MAPTARKERSGRSGRGRRTQGGRKEAQAERGGGGGTDDAPCPPRRRAAGESGRGAGGARAELLACQCRAGGAAAGVALVTLLLLAAALARAVVVGGARWLHVPLLGLFRCDVAPCTLLAELAVALAALELVRRAPQWLAVGLLLAKVGLVRITRVPRLFGRDPFTVGAAAGENARVAESAYPVVPATLCDELALAGGWRRRARCRPCPGCATCSGPASRASSACQSDLSRSGARDGCEGCACRATPRFRSGCLACCGKACSTCTRTCLSRSAAIGLCERPALPTATRGSATTYLVPLTTPPGAGLLWYRAGPDGEPRESFIGYLTDAQRRELTRRRGFPQRERADRTVGKCCARLEDHRETDADLGVAQAEAEGRRISVGPLGTGARAGGGLPRLSALTCVARALTHLRTPAAWQRAAG